MVAMLVDMIIPSQEESSMAIDKSTILERLAFVTAVVLVAATLAYHSAHARPVADQREPAGDLQRHVPSSGLPVIEKE